MPSPSDILSAVAPKFDTVDGARRSTVLAIATSQVGAAFGTQRNTAIAYLAAHMLEIDPEGGAGGGAGGAVIGEKEGQLERTYGALTGGGAGIYGRTVWGQEFVRIRRQCVMGARTRVSNMVIPTGEM